MDLAQTFNHAGCILFEKRQYEEAYDAFCGALQSLVHSCHGKSKCQLDDNNRVMLLMDPAIQRAYDRIAMTGLFHHHKVACEKYVQHEHEHQRDQPHHEESSTGLTSSSRGWAEEDEAIAEANTLKPIMIPTSMDVSLPESSLSVSLQFFATAMAIVWTNQGIVLQMQRNLHRSLACYALARDWMCHTANTTVVAVTAAATTGTDHCVGGSSGGSGVDVRDRQDVGSLPMSHLVRKALFNTIVYNIDKIRLGIDSIHS